MDPLVENVSDETGAKVLRDAPWADQAEGGVGVDALSQAGLRKIGTVKYF